MGWCNASVSTGALIAHGLSESVGKTHYRVPPSVSDEELFKKGYNRVYDTLEMEANLNYVEHVVGQTMKRIDPDQPLSSELLTRELGQTLAEGFDGDRYSQERLSEKSPGLHSGLYRFRNGAGCRNMGYESRVDQARAQAKGGSDLDVLRAIINRILRSILIRISTVTRAIISAKRLGIFTIGGGVPRNWSQQVGPYIEISNTRLGLMSAPPIPIRRANLSGAGSLGRVERLYLSRRRFLGKVCAAGRRWAVCRSVERCHGCLASAHGRVVGAQKSKACSRT